MGTGAAHAAGELPRLAAASTVATLFEGQARLFPDRIAVVDGARELRYRELDGRSRRLAAALLARGVRRGDRIAILSENRLEILELFLAAARLGAIVACQNARLAAPELAHCLAIVEPKVALVSPRHRDALLAAGAGAEPVVLGGDYERLLAASDPGSSCEPKAPGQVVDPEDPLLLLYTSGTTGLPKGALISHRAEVIRNLVVRAEFGVAPDDTFVAWSPLYHMGAADCSIGALLSGGKVIVVDGFDEARLAELVVTEDLGWLLLMPGMVGRFSREIARRGARPKGIKICGVMADLVPPSEIAEVTSLLAAPYANTFGATETGCPPGAASPIPIGVAPERLSKHQSRFCEVRLVDAEDLDVADGAPGELCMRGPTLFSGYWREPDVNRRDFRGGWFHMGDVFVRNPDRTMDFVDRVKYLIKSGGENVYPAEIERVMMSDPRVAEAAVVRAYDERWGEVPVAFVARRDPSLAEEDLVARCRAELAGYKQPRRILFVSADELPRSASGKVQRHELEARLRDEGAGGERDRS